MFQTRLVQFTLLFFAWFILNKLVRFIKLMDKLVYIC